MVVKFDFLEGVKRVKKYLENDIELTKDHLLEQAATAKDIDNLRKLVDDFDIYEHTVNKALEDLQMATTIVDVLDSVEDTVLGVTNEVVIGLVLGIEIEAI